MACQRQSHLVPQIQTPPALPFSPYYFHPGSEAAGFRDVGLVTSLLAALSSLSPCHPDLNRADSRPSANEPGGWMVEGEEGMKGWGQNGHVVPTARRDFGGGEGQNDESG